MAIDQSAAYSFNVPSDITSADYPGEVKPEDHSAPADVCSACSGTGWELVPGKGVRHCNCLKQGRQSQLLTAARIPRRFSQSTLQNFHPAKGVASQLQAFKSAYQLVRKYPNVERGLLFMGPVGVGKTHLAVSILRGLVEKQIPCLFYDFGALLKEIQQSYNSTSQISELSVLGPVYETEVLLLDEMGASKPTEWVCDTLRQIIGKRYNDRKLTFFTTNYTDVRGRPTDETLEDRIGARLRSRLYEMCRTVIMEGEDYRRQFDAK